MKTNLVIQSFGRENEYKRAILTILSYYAHCKLPVEQTRVMLFTDKPGYFSQYLEGLPIDYILLTPAKIRHMRGKIDFLHRMKIAVIEEAFSKMEGNMLYADSDTFFTADPTPFIQQVAADKSFMHLWEYTFESMRELPLPMGETFHAFLRLIEANSFDLSNGSKITVSPQQVSWNAGVMMFHPTHIRFITDVYTLTDQFYPPTHNHASEQYAFSVMLQNHTQIQACDTVIYHYWYRIKKQIIDLYLEERLAGTWCQLPLSSKLEQIRRWCKQLPHYLNTHILTIRDNAIQAFNEDQYKTAYKHVLKAITTSPFDKEFFKDVLYHSRRKMFKK